MLERYKMHCSVINFNDAYTQIAFDDSLKLKCQHAAHCCIYSPFKFQYETYESQAYVSVS